MNNCKICLPFLSLGYHFCGSCGKRLKGVQGPEQGLVEESRSDGQQGHAEVAQPGERGVGKIVELNKLLRQIDIEIRQARLGGEVAMDQFNDCFTACYDHGQEAGLRKLRRYAEYIAEERSDLPNDQTEARP